MTLPGLTVVDDVPGAFADRVIEAFGARAADDFSIALSGGETARRCYERLAEEGATRIDWWKVVVYWGDERCVPHDHEDSNYLLARDALLDRVGAAQATHLMRCGEVDAVSPDGRRFGLGQTDVRRCRLPERRELLPDQLVRENPRDDAVRREPAVVPLALLAGAGLTLLVSLFA